MDNQSPATNLTCTQCGGELHPEEGQVFLTCPYCSATVYVDKSRVVFHWFLAPTLKDDQARGELARWMAGNQTVKDLDKKARLAGQSFQAYLPFWMTWGRVLSWVFGEKEVGSGHSSHYEHREVKVMEDMTWNGAAVDVGEFGVTQMPLTDQQLEPFNPETLHRLGLVFEPVGSTSDARSAAEKDFNDRIRNEANLDRLSQVFTRVVRPRMGLVSFPLWVLRYIYKGRTFQVVVDGYSGKVLYGKAPGNTLYRAAMLVGGMFAGAVIAINGPVLLLSATSGSHSGNLFLFALGALVFGLGLMWAGYRAFRYGEEYEYRSGPKAYSLPVGSDIMKNVRSVINVMEKFQ